MVSWEQSEEGAPGVWGGNHLCHMLLVGQVKWEVRTDHLDLLLVMSLRVVLLGRCRCNWGGLGRAGERKWKEKGSMGSSGGVFVLKSSGEAGEWLKRM